MNDLQKYVSKRRATDLDFADGFESGYSDFKIGILLRQTRESDELTQEQVLIQLSTKIGDLEY
jgi:HTH-type transcriptional regulator / antitoxin HipB